MLFFNIQFYICKWEVGTDEARGPAVELSYLLKLCQNCVSGVGVVTKGILSGCYSSAGPHFWHGHWFFWSSVTGFTVITYGRRHLHIFMTNLLIGRFTCSHHLQDPHTIIPIPHPDWALRKIKKQSGRRWAILPRRDNEKTGIPTPQSQTSWANSPSRTW